MTTLTITPSKKYINITTQDKENLTFLVDNLVDDYFEHIEDKKTKKNLSENHKFIDLNNKIETKLWNL